MNFILQQLLYPMGRRVGTAAAGAFVSYAAITDQATVNAIEVAFVAVFGVGLDLINSWLERR